MSRENLEIVRRLVDAINADAIPRDLFTRDFEIRNAVTAVTDATYIGHDGALQWRRDLQRPPFLGPPNPCRVVLVGAAF